MFEIIVDSAANIPAQIVKEYNIKVISFVNLVNGTPLVCFDPTLTEEEERIKGKAYYDSVKDGAVIQTGLISSGDFLSTFKEVIEQDKDLIYISLSKNISGTYNSARLAAEELMENPPCNRKIRLVDSMNASLGQGLLAIYASEMRAEGKEVDEVADTLLSYQPKMNGVFTVGDLKYLSKSGRISGSVATIGNILNIKPILKGSKDGFIVQHKKCRGRKTALSFLINAVCNNIVNAEEQIIGIAHADAYEESLYVMNEIKKRINVRRFINTSYDYCTGSHVGPDTIALFFMAKDRELTN